MLVTLRDKRVKEFNGTDRKIKKKTQCEAQAVINNFSTTCCLIYISLTDHL